MKVAIVDGQGGGIGKVIADKIKKHPDGNKIHIIALGTNAMATAAMLKAGANEGATGENAIIYNSDKVDLIVGTVAVISANAILGEVSAKIAEAISSSSAKKILIPISRCSIEIVGAQNRSLPELIDKLIERIFESLNQKNTCKE